MRKRNSVRISCRRILGLPLRSNYSGIRGTPGGSAKAQLDRFIKRWVEEERQALEQQKRAKLAAEGLAPTGPLKCDLCPPTDPTTYKSKIFLNRHKDSAHR